MAIHSLTIDGFSALHLRLDGSQRMTSQPRERLCIVKRVTED